MNEMRPTGERVEPEQDRDLALVHDAKQGNTTAFELLIRRHTSKVFRVAFSVTKCHEDAEEVVQDAFVKAFNKLNTFEERSRFSTWLTRIVINTALTKVRGKHGFNVVPMTEGETGTDIVAEDVVDWRPNPEQLYSQRELREILAKTLDSLSDNYRTVVVLRDIEDFSIAETAEILNLSVTAVKMRLMRARLQLREKLSHYFHDGNKQPAHLSYTFGSKNIAAAGVAASAMRITTGRVALGPDDSQKQDVVVMDDFSYGEPQPLP